MFVLIILCITLGDNRTHTPNRVDTPDVVLDMSDPLAHKVILAL